MSGLWKHGEEDHPLEILLKGRIDIKNLFALSQTSLFPEEIRSKTSGFESLSGTGQIAFKGKNHPGPSRFSFEGEFITKEVSLLQKGTTIPLVFKEGMLSFSNQG
jgi:hypothetical protein